MITKRIIWICCLGLLFLGGVSLWKLATSSNPLMNAIRHTFYMEMYFKCRNPYALLGWEADKIFEDKQVLELAHAIQKNNIPKIKKLVADGVNVNTTGKDGMTPLYYAIAAEDETFRCLLELGANPWLPSLESCDSESLSNSPNCCDWSNSVLMVLLQGKGDYVEWIRSRNRNRSTKLDDALKYAKNYQKNGKLPDNMLYEFFRKNPYPYSMGELHADRIMSVIQSGGNVNYTYEGVSILSMFISSCNSYKAQDVALRMLQEGADMCAVAGPGQEYYLRDVCFWVANYVRYPPQKELVEEIEKQGGDVELARSMKDKDERINFIPPGERPWLDGVYEKRWFQEPEME
ncbi:MAG: ankyrin repeat domain-containing protein [Planctomycetia bacterium]|nr:ankyrin repeat domain-containing protein [Planctomycetia bacterium]